MDTSNITIFTLTNTGFEPFTAGMINSAYENGFRGNFVVGTNDDNVKSFDNDLISLKKISEDKLWIGNLKPRLILESSSEYFLWLDSDIIINSPNFFKIICDILPEKLFLSLEGFIPSSDIRRHTWSKKLSNEKSNTNNTSEYFSSGILGGKFNRDKDLLKSWEIGMHKALSQPAKIFQNPFFLMPDQDVLNGVIQNCTTPYATICTPDIWYDHKVNYPWYFLGSHENEHLILHAVGDKMGARFKKTPPHLPSLYDKAWYKIVMSNPNLVKLKIDLPYNIDSWLQEKWWSKLIVKIKSLLKKIF